MTNEADNENHVSIRTGVTSAIERTSVHFIASILKEAVPVLYFVLVSIKTIIIKLDNMLTMEVLFNIVLSVRLSMTSIWKRSP